MNYLYRIYGDCIGRKRSIVEVKMAILKVRSIEIMVFALAV